MSDEVFTVPSAVTRVVRIAHEVGLQPRVRESHLVEFAAKLANKQTETVLCRIKEKNGEARHYVFEVDAGLADPEKYESALMHNAQTDFGAIGIRSVEGVDRFIVSCLQAVPTSDPPEVKAAVDGVAQAAAFIKAFVKP